MCVGESVIFLGSAEASRGVKNTTMSGVFMLNSFSGCVIKPQRNVRAPSLLKLYSLEGAYDQVQLARRPYHL